MKQQQQTTTLLPADPPTSLGRPVIDQPTDVSLMSIIERAAKDPAVDVDKLERLVTLHERALGRSAEQAFNAAMSAAQTDMRPVAEDAYNPQTKSRYASYAALDKALRPIYTAHGFGLSFDTGDSARESWIRVVCYVTHTAGHARTYHIDMPADGKGAKGGDAMTVTHAVGAGTSYGMRYLLRMIWNVAVGEDDRDGNGESQPVIDPDGFQSWALDLQLTAQEGLDALRTAWKASPDAMRLHMTTHYSPKWEALKVAAAKVAS